MAKLKRFRLVDIQSWDETSGWVEMDSELMNIIIGRNETGKSVLYKVLAQMFIPSQFGNDRKDLVRDGCSFGLAFFQLDTDVTVVFKINRNNTQEYQIIYPDGRKFNAQGDDPPAELAHVFNWFVDTKEGVILNLLHKDTNLPFILTSKSFNAQLLRFLNEDPRIEHIRTVFEENGKLLQEGIKEVHRKVDKLDYRFRSIEYIDVQSKKQILDRCYTLQSIWGEFTGVLEGTRILSNQPEVAPPKFTRPEIVGFIDSIPTVSELHGSLSQLCNCLNQIPEEKDYSMLETLRLLAEHEPPTQDLVLWSNKLYSALEGMPTPGDYECLETLETLTAIERSTKTLRAQLEALVKTLDSIPPEKEYPLEALGRAKNHWDMNHKLLVSIAGVLQGLMLADKASANLVSIENQIRQVQEELGVCPTCGRHFE